MNHIHFEGLIQRYRKHLGNVFGGLLRIVFVEHWNQTRMYGWQLESFKESYTYKVKNGISLFKEKKLNEQK